MRTLRRLLARSLLAPFLLLPLLSCAYPRPSADAVEKALGRASTYVEPKTILVPRRIEAFTDGSAGGGPLDDHHLAKIDAALAILHVNHLVEIQDVYGPGGDGGYLHIVTVSPAADAPPGLFTEVDEATVEDRFGPRVRRTPGWRIALAQRKLVGISQILDSGSPAADRLSPGYVLVGFEFRWIPTSAGKLFDQAAPEFDDLPADLRIATMYAGDLDSHRTFAGRAWMTRDKNGAWKVTLFDCPRACTTTPT